MTTTKTLRANDPELRPLTELVKQFPRRPSRTTLWRWVWKGRRDKSDQIIKLPVIEICGQYHTTPTAIFSFLENSPTQKPVSGRTAKREADLRSLGLLK